ncbi:hypothetical protein [Desulfohalovibrio reitneri]|uniref:hypothetical protein n=1 Tax=Desulfohalovibrio reitneri TaxID=1307759 RepID=UPI00068B8C4A|nr:hypothetical protein [Desulfohalovibrio reitneri]
MRRSPILPLAFALLVFLAAGAQAHRVNVFAYVEGESIHVSGTFPGGGPAKDCRVLALGPSGAELAETATDDRGEAVLPVPDEARDGSMDLTVALEAGQGHRDEWVVPATEIASAMGVETTEAAAPKVEEAAEPASGEEMSVSRAELRRIISAEVAAQVRPVKDMLARRESGPGLAEVVGGLGWIVGLAGAWVLGASRRKGGDG